MTFRRIFGPRSGSVPTGDVSVTGPYPSSYVPTATLKTQLHCHTSQSHDGSIPPSTMVANYVNAGYDALALTDHDKVTSQPTGADYAIVGNELSPSAQHIISINSSYVRGGTTNAQTIIDGVVAAGGQSHIAHPTWYAGMTYAEMAALSGHMGFEIHNGLITTGGGQNPVTYPGFSVDRWDALLAAGKKTGVWGFSVDDLHAVGAFATYDMGCVKVFVESASVANIVAALVAGNFVADVSNFGITPGYPVLSSSDVALSCTGATRIEAWGKLGQLASHTGSSYTYTFDGSEGYVRLVAIGDYTEPWDSISDRWGTYDGSWAVASGALSVSSDATFRRLILRRHRQGDFAAQTDIQVNGTTAGARADVQRAGLVALLHGPHRRVHDRRVQQQANDLEDHDRQLWQPAGVLHVHRQLGHLVHREDGLRCIHRAHPRQGVGHRGQPSPTGRSVPPTRPGRGAASATAPTAPAPTTTCTSTASRRSTSLCSSTLPSGPDNRSGLDPRPSGRGSFAIGTKV